MKNEDAWRAVREYSSDATHQARKLGAAAVALCWLLRERGEFSAFVQCSLLLAGLYFVLDLGQYLAGAYLHRRWLLNEEKSHQGELGDAEFWFPPGIDVPIRWLARCKMAFLAGTFLLLGLYLFLPGKAVTPPFGDAVHAGESDSQRGQLSTRYPHADSPEVPPAATETMLPDGAGISPKENQVE